MSKAGEFVISRIRVHVCGEYCPPHVRVHHLGTWELDSDDFITATQMTPKRDDGTAFAPD